RSRALGLARSHGARRAGRRPHAPRRENPPELTHFVCSRAPSGRGERLARPLQILRVREKEHMMKNLHRALLMAGGLALAAGTAAPPAEAQISVQFRFGTPDRPLEGRRYQTMRALSHYLDEEAWEAS